MPKLVSRADFARLTGKSRAAVTQHCARKLKPACVGDRIDLTHSAAKAYLGEHRATPARSDVTPTKPKKSAKSTPSGKSRSVKSSDSESFDPTKPLPYTPIPDETGDVTELACWTLKQIVDQLGTLRSYKDHLEAYEKQERALKYHLENLETMGELIERDRVANYVFAIINAGFERLLRDVPRNVTARAYAAARSDTPLEESEAMIRDAISAILKPIRDSVQRSLKRKKKH